MALPADARAKVAAQMKLVREAGLDAARHVRGEVYEIRATSNKLEYRVLFSNEGAKGRILLALEGFTKKTARTPPHLIDLALDRLRDWRARADSRADDEA